jgi:serine/threonine protein kinase
LAAKFAGKASAPVLDLLGKLLRFDPAERLPALEALEHPWFAGFKDARVTVNGKTIVDLFDFGDVELGGSEAARDRLTPAWYKKMKSKLG